MNTMAGKMSEISVSGHDCAWFLLWAQEKLLLYADIYDDPEEVTEFEDDENDYMRVRLEGSFH